jgi:inosose dehydratase
MNNVLIGCGQITWPKVPEEQVLAEIAQAGYAGAPAGPSNGRTPQETSALFAQFGLQPAPGYFAPEFWKVEQEAEILSAAREYARYTRALGLTEMYVATGGFGSYVTARGLTRAQVSGHVTPADGMSDAEWTQFARALTLASAITLEEGVASCFHNHVGSVIETRAEIDRLLSLVDRSVVFLGPDTGHLAWAGADPVQFCRDYASSIKTMHLKDINADVLRQGVAAGWDYGAFSEHGIWTELGTGAVDFPAIFAILEQAGFSGWLIVETDVTQLPSALESALISRSYLREQLGM